MDTAKEKEEEKKTSHEIVYYIFENARQLCIGPVPSAMVGGTYASGS